MITKETYLKLINLASIEEDEKYYLTEIISAVDNITDLPSDLLLRLEEILTAEQEKSQIEKEKLEQEKIELETTYEKEKNELPAKLQAIDQQMIEEVKKAAEESMLKLDEIDKTAFKSAEAEKKAIDNQRYLEILNNLKKK